VRRRPSAISALRSPSRGHRAVTCLSRCVSCPISDRRFDPSGKPSYHEMRHLAVRRANACPPKFSGPVEFLLQTD
jgi:hypothetical protein